MYLLPNLFECSSDCHNDTAMMAANLYNTNPLWHPELADNYRIATTTSTAPAWMTSSQPFLIVLHQLLDEEIAPSIISWEPHGRSFHIHDIKRFVLCILPRYFPHTNFSSFQRQLYEYGLQRVTSPRCRDYGSYYHELFVRRRPDLCRFIRRQRRISSPTLPTVVGIGSPVSHFSLGSSSPNVHTSYIIPSPPMSSSTLPLPHHMPMTSIIESNRIIRHHDNLVIDKVGGTTKNNSCRIHGNTSPTFRPLPMKPRLPNAIVVMRTKTSHNTSATPVPSLQHAVPCKASSS